MTNAISWRILALVLAIAVVIAFTPAIAFTQSASAATRPGKVLWSSITKTPTTITLKWKKASKVKGCSVYQKKSGKYKKIKPRPDGTKIDGATGSSYTTPPLSASDNGNIYRCVVSNGSSTAYGEGTLKVTAP